jgi:ribosomal-protein-alanine N-acetyltransferase
MGNVEEAGRRCALNRQRSLPPHPMPFISPPPCESARILLRPVQADDIPDLFEMNRDDVTTRYLPYASWQSLEDGAAWFKRISDLAAGGTSLQLVMVEKASGRVIGACVLFRYEEGSARAEIGYAMARAYWGKGLAREAIGLLVEQAFIVHGVRRLEAEVNPLNQASVRLLTTLGFVLEGQLRQRWMAKGIVYDTHLYGLLHDEWLVGRTRAAPI